MPRRALVWIGLAMWAAWAAAASAQPAAPIEYRGLPSAPASVPPPPEAPPPSAPHSSPAPEAPQAGWEGPGTPLSAYALRPEEAHPYDPARLPQSHRVQPGQTIYDIATLYQIPLRALIDQNGLSAPFALHVGQVLRLPPPRFYTIAAGDTLESVARQFNVDARSLALLNRLQSPYGVRVGQTLVLPAIARAAEPEPQSHGDPAPQAAAQTPPPAGDGRFAWPVRGEIAVRFGAQPGGRRSDGVEIEAPEGARFVAAADGEVVYAGADLPAYGALIMIRHADGWVTAYAYGRRALVSEGAHVRRGQPIGEVGAHRGRGLLLFQVRQGRAAVDPLPLLGAP